MIKIIAGKQNAIKQVNKSLIVNTLRSSGELTAPDIAKEINLSLPTVIKLLNELLEDKTIRLNGIAESTGGRRANLYDINDNKVYLIISLESEGMQITAVMLNGEILQKGDYIIKYKECSDIIAKVCDNIDNFISKNKLIDIDLIGIGVPGVVTAQNYIYSIPTILELNKSNIKDKIEARYNVKVIIERDVIFSTIGVHNTMLKKKYSDIVYLFFSKGIGLGIIIENKLYKGINSASGDIGYMITHNELEEMNETTINRYKQEEKGFYEDRIESTLNKFMKKYDLDNIKEIKKYIDKTEEDCGLLQSLIKDISYALINVLSFYDPQAIVVEGYFISDKLFGKVKDYLKQYFNMENRKIELILAKGENLGISGAVNYCFLEANGASRLTEDIIF